MHHRTRLGGCAPGMKLEVIYPVRNCFEVRKCGPRLGFTATKDNIPQFAVISIERGHYGLLVHTHGIIDIVTRVVAGGGLIKDLPGNVSPDRAALILKLRKLALGKRRRNDLARTNANTGKVKLVVERNARSQIFYDRKPHAKSRCQNRLPETGLL